MFLKIVTPGGRQEFYRSLTAWLKACRARKLKAEVSKCQEPLPITDQSKMKTEYHWNWVGGKMWFDSGRKSHVYAGFVEHTNCLNDVPLVCPSWAFCVHPPHLHPQTLVLGFPSINSVSDSNLTEGCRGEGCAAKWSTGGWCTDTAGNGWTVR